MKISLGKMRTGRIIVNVGVEVQNSITVSGHSSIQRTYVSESIMSHIVPALPLVAGVPSDTITDILQNTYVAFRVDIES
jgi:hypothetical protein